jgi:hypothetical protein
MPARQSGSRMLHVNETINLISFSIVFLIVRFLYLRCKYLIVRALELNGLPRSPPFWGMIEKPPHSRALCTQ